MKCLQRSCCLLCVLALSLTVFSINAHAKDVSPSSYTVHHDFSIYNSTNANGSRVYGVDYIFNPLDGYQTYFTEYEIYTIPTYSNYSLVSSYTFEPDEPPLLYQGENATVTAYDLLYSVGVKNTASDLFSYWRNVSSVKVLATYSDNTNEYLSGVTYTQDGNKITFTCNTPVTKDIKTLKFIVISNFITTSNGYKITAYLGEHNGADVGYKISFNQLSEEGGLLSGLLAKVTEFKDNVSNGFSNMLKSITELPQKIWTLISDGLKNLFVPSEDFIVQYKEDLDSMLEEKLGAVYQVVDITLESWDRISVSDEQNSIELPETTIDLPEGNKWSFGGYDVKIVPDGFEVLANAIKLIGGICITILFVNGLRGRYDEVMGVEK